MLLKITGLGANTAAFELLLLPLAINDRHVWVATKNVEIFGVLNTDLIFTEVTTNLALQPVSRGVGRLRCVASKSSALNVSLVCLCLVFLILLSICIGYSVTFQLSGLLSSTPSSSAVSGTAQMLFSKLSEVVYFFSQASTLSCLNLSCELLH